MARVHSGEETLPKASTPWLWCTNVTDRQMTEDGFATAKTRTSRSHVPVKISKKMLNEMFCTLVLTSLCINI